jgi:APA family basic amino acid/polyamine antiporter
VLVCIGVIIMRHTHPATVRPFRTPMVPVVPILGVGFNLVMMYFLGWSNWLRLFVWMALGLIVYFKYSRKHSLFQQTDAAHVGER